MSLVIHKNIHFSSFNERILCLDNCSMQVYSIFLMCNYITKIAIVKVSLYFNQSDIFFGNLSSIMLFRRKITVSVITLFPYMLKKEIKF